MVLLVLIVFSQGYRDTQKAIVEMTEKAAEVDQMKGATLEEISAMVEQITREFKNKQAQLQPLIAKLKVLSCNQLPISNPSLLLLLLPTKQR